ncbi:methyltransferase domain-containing protein [Sphingomonas sp.]|uniref:class I SAM-dependent methyltransferase n=1 Tax=Sphingomonas sp. TaxID=28214 RepID=UPI0025F44D96|nr:methyltransferase domain-containing protein [Sphingomonas sp.]
MAINAIYDRIGTDYARRRQADPRVARLIHAALGTAQSVVNVGAGAGAYEPAGRALIAVEPSAAMIAQRPAGAAPALCARAEALPLANKCVDAALAVLTVHHWADKTAGMRELRRVARGAIVLLTYDPAHRPWLTDYLPQLAALDAAQMPAMADYARWLGPVRISPVLVPHDCIDGFLYAYWRRPEAYLDPAVRAGSSSFWAIDGAEQGLAALADDLRAGAWARRYASVAAEDSYDAGYRLVVAPG